jgi:prepilin signal peptidase PulO-like enzyme (type II secretory pathway)
MMLALLGALLAAVAGAVVGTLVATTAARLAVGAPLGAPPMCLRTRRRLPWADAAPIIGYLRRGGRCRMCGYALPRWAPLTEAGMALLATVAYFSAGGWNLRFALYVLELAVLLVILIMDWRRHEIYTVVLLAGAAVGLAAGWALPEIGLVSALGGALAGGGLMLIIYGFGRLMGRLRYGREGMAWGDVELAVALGLITGFPGVITPLFWGPIVGVLLFLRRGLGNYFPFAPGLCLVSMFFVLAHTSNDSWWDTLRLPLLGNIIYFTGVAIWKVLGSLLQLR